MYTLVGVFFDRDRFVKRPYIPRLVTFILFDVLRYLYDSRGEHTILFKMMPLIVKIGSLVLSL